MMKGQITLQDWLADQAVERAAREAESAAKECEIRLKPSGGWTTVTAKEALAWARGRYTALKGIRQTYRAEYINDYLLRGIRFTDNELRG